MEINLAVVSLQSNLDENVSDLDNLNWPLQNLWQVGINFLDVSYSYLEPIFHLVQFRIAISEMNWGTYVYSLKVYFVLLLIFQVIN